MTRTLPHASRCALSQGLLPPQRYPSVEIHHSQAFPTQVSLRPRAYHAPRRLTPSTVSLVSFQPGALTGLGPTELDLTEIVTTSQRNSPMGGRPHRRRALNTVAGATDLAIFRCRSCFLGLSLCRLGFHAAGFLRTLQEPWLSWAFPLWGVPLPCSRFF